MPISTQEWLVLVNPSAGRKPVGIDRVRSALDRAGVVASIATPSSPGAMSTAIFEARGSGVRHIAVVGGDGTANLAANEQVRQAYLGEI